MRRLFLAAAFVLAAGAAHAAGGTAILGGTRLARIIAVSGTVVTNTGIGTSEVNMASINLPAMGANDAIRVTTFWDTTGSTATNTKNLIVRLGSSGCTPLGACSAGTPLVNLVANSSSLITWVNEKTVWNAGATNSQIFIHPNVTSGLGSSNSAAITAAIQTNAGGAYINIDSITAATSADTIKLTGYVVEWIPGN